MYFYVTKHCIYFHEIQDMGTRREGRDQNVIINHRYTQFNNSIPVAVASPGFFFRGEGGGWQGALGGRRAFQDCKYN